ncbi:beta-lactamase [Lysobacter arseniciresistens ZS79]|uniref:Beta-lactamase n=1 Tax=Lysobacter arseniciresistens ZS79 TaxID=913325 RepID=A0A0A0F5W2_9GAMM|nr:beta-lactamase [Lysobacter arseniciresistens ZS79]
MRATVLALGLSLATAAVAQAAAPVSTAATAAQTTPPASTAADPSPAPAPEPPTTAPATTPLHGFDAYVENAREQFDVPAIAVAIVKDGEVVLERGYGVKDLESREPVDARTMFAIASNTKAFTATALQILARDGKLAMDDRVIDHLPWFRMADPYITREMRIRDLLAHRSGLALGAGDLLYWPGTDYTTEEVARRLAHVPVDGGFREQYAYDNILFGVAQLVIEAASGQTFEAFLRQRILQPLGMDETRFNSDHLRAGDNVATGYSKADFTDLVAAPRMSWGNVSGAGGLYSSVHDLAEWVRVQLDQGVIEGEGEDARRLFGEDEQRDMWNVLTPIPLGKPSKVPELAAAAPNFRGYAQGWNVSDYRGERLVWHTGGWPGFFSRVTLVPEQELGIIVLTSAEVDGAFNSVTMRALDAMLDAPATDWTAAYLASRGNQQDEADEDWRRHVAARDAGSKPSLPLDGYAATYRDPWYGDVVVERGDDGLRIRFTRSPALVGRLAHWQHDTFVVRWDQRWLNADAFLTFDLDPDGEVRAARMEAISPLTDFSFDFHHLRLVPVDADDAGEGA